MDFRAFIFLPALVGSVVFGFVFLLFICHYYLSVLESTAAGAKEIPWVSEPITDNFWKFWYLGWLLGLWLGPAFMLGRAVAGGAESEWARLLAAFLLLWLCYPVSQLSSLSASSVWYPLTPDVFARLSQKPVVVLQFFGLSALVMLAFAVGFKWTFQTSGEWELLFVGAPLTVIAALFYARLLGRLAFVLRYTKGLFPTKRRKKAEPDTEPSTTPEAKPKPKPKNKQPVDLPPVNTPDGELTGYAVTFEDDPPAAPKKRVKAEVAEPEPDAVEEVEPRPARRRTTAPKDVAEAGRTWTDEDDEEPAAYGVHEAEITPAEKTATEVIKPSEQETRLLSRSDRPKKPKRAWNGELFAFLAQPGTISAIIIASSLCFLLGAMIRVARQFNPASGGD